jgi:hypothetical protein
LEIGRKMEEKKSTYQSWNLHGPYAYNMLALELA